MRWIPVSEGMPTEAEADEYGEVLWRWADGSVSVEPLDSVDGPHWMPIPPLTPEPSVSTVEVRVPVAVGNGGEWFATGDSSWHGDEAGVEALHEVHGPKQLYWLTVTLPIPQPAEPITVEAEVEAT